MKVRRPFRWYGPGSEPPAKVATFEKEFARRMQSRYALAVTSGSAALQTAVAACEIGPGDEIILPAWTWHSCFNAIVLAGALPVFAEIDESFNIDPADIERKITPQTKLIMAVHLQGNPAAMDRVLEIAKRHRIRVLEDCAQAMGASYKGRPVGRSATSVSTACRSTRPLRPVRAEPWSPTIRCCLSAPAVITTSEPCDRSTSIKWEARKVESLAGSQFRMSEFTGSVLLAQLRKLGRIVDSVRSSARRVYDGIRDLPGIQLRGLPDPEGELGAAVFVGFDSKATCDRFRAPMKAENVPASLPGGSAILPIAPHVEHKRTVHPAWPSFTSERGRAIRYGAECCPRTLDILSRFAGVSLDPTFTRNDTDDIVAAIRKVYPQVVRA